MEASALDAGVVASMRRVVLARGRTLLVRRAVPEDGDGLAGLAARAIATAEAGGGFGLVAVVHGPGASGSDRGDFAGAASYELVDGGDARMSLAVAPAWRGWLGAFLVDALLDAAAARGVEHLEADVAAGDAVTLGIVLARPCAAVPVPAGRRVLLATHGSSPTWPGAHDRPRVLVEALDGAWAIPAWAQTAGIEVLVCPGPRSARPACPALAGQACRLAAAADAIVIVAPPGDHCGRELMVAHRNEHPGVPVFVDRGGDADRATLPGVVEGVARTHARRSDGWVGGVSRTAPG
jgi:hypothetical protein